MTTTRTVTFEYSESSAEVGALLQDPIYLRQRSETAGEHNIDVKVEAVQGGTRVTVAREKDVEVPAFAKMVLGSARRAVETTLWRPHGEQWVAEYQIEVSGVPVTTKGRSVLAPSAGGCSYTSTFEINAKIPFIGGRIEALVADGLVEQLLENCKRNAAALSRGKGATNSFIGGLAEGASKAAKGA